MGYSAFVSSRNPSTNPSMRSTHEQNHETYLARRQLLLQLEDPVAVLRSPVGAAAVPIAAATLLRRADQAREAVGVAPPQRLLGVGELLLENLDTARRPGAIGRLVRQSANHIRVRIKNSNRSEHIPITPLHK